MTAPSLGEGELSSNASVHGWLRHADDTSSSRKRLLKWERTPALQLRCSPLPCRGLRAPLLGGSWAAPWGGRPEGCALKGGGEVWAAVGGVVLLQALPEASVGLGSSGVCLRAPAQAVAVACITGLLWKGRWTVVCWEKGSSRCPLLSYQVQDPT